MLTRAKVATGGGLVSQGRSGAAFGDLGVIAEDVNRGGRASTSLESSVDKGKGGDGRSGVSRSGGAAFGDLGVVANNVDGGGAAIGGHGCERGAASSSDGAIVLGSISVVTGGGGGGGEGKCVESVSVSVSVSSGGLDMRSGESTPFEIISPFHRVVS